MNKKYRFCISTFLICCLVGNFTFVSITASFEENEKELFAKQENDKKNDYSLFSEIIREYANLKKTVTTKIQKFFKYFIEKVPSDIKDIGSIINSFIHPNQEKLEYQIPKYIAVRNDFIYAGKN